MLIDKQCGEGAKDMSLTWLIIMAVVIVVIIYEMVHRSLIKRATLIVQRRAQTITDRVVFETLDQIIGSHSYQHRSTLVSDVWGKGVLSFEYDIEDHTEKKTEFSKLTRQEIEDRINYLADQQQVDHIKDADQAFKITDWWQGKKHFHMDVTYLMNEASFEYVHDLRKLGE